MSNIQFTTVDRIFASVTRDIRGEDINESDLIEWIGEAMGFMDMPELQEESVAFLKVKDFEADVPDGFQMALQLARYNKVEKDICADCCKIEEIEEDKLPDPDYCGEISIIDYMLGNLDTSFRPYFDMQWQYIPWTTSHYFVEHFKPIRLTNHTLFNTLVCKEKDFYYNCDDEYTIVGTVDKKFRFSFSEGYVALSYLKAATDKETGYPLVPDNVRHTTAITYYIKWKIAERLEWLGREGFTSITNKNMELWNKYVKQAKNWSKMPKGIDQHQNLLEQTHHLIPRLNRYYGFFGKLGKQEYRGFNY